MGCEVSGRHKLPSEGDTEVVWCMAAYLNAVVEGRDVRSEAKSHLQEWNHYNQLVAKGIVLPWSKDQAVNQPTARAVPGRSGGHHRGLSIWSSPSCHEIT